MTNKKIVESTTAGAVASVAMPLGSTQKRAGSLFKGKKTKKKFYETRTFNSKQELIQYFLSRGKTAAEASAAWERGYRGTTKKKKKSSQLPKEHWVDRHEREKEEREERNKPPVTEQRKNKVYEGKMKNLAHDLQNLSPEEFIKEHKRTKEYFITLLGNPNKNTKVDNVSEAEIVETDLIITPGMKKNKERGFIPHDKVRKDHEVEMARSDVYSAAKDATRIYRLIKDRTEDEGLMGWQQSYITLAADYLNSVADSLEHNTKTNEMTGGVLAGGMSNFEEGMDEGQVNELSPQTLASYKKKAGADATAADKRGDYARGNKRMRGIIKATKKEFDKSAKGVTETEINNYEEGITEEFKNTFSVGDRVDGPLGKGTIVAVSKNVDVDGRVKVKLDDPSRAGEDGRYKDSFVLDTTHLKHINDQDMSEAYHDDSKEQEENLRYSRSRNPVSDDIRKKLNPNQKEQGVMDTTMSNFEEAEERKPRVNVKHLLDKMLQLQNTALMAIDRERWSELEQVKNEMEEIENKVRNSGPDGDKTMDEFFQRLGSKEPIDVLEPKMYKKDNIKENRWRNRLYGLKWNPLDRERREQGARDREARSERNREINAGLEGEEEQARRYEQGPWYILINGKLVKDKSKNPFTFNTLSAAQKAVKTMREKEWNKDKTFAYTKTPKDSDITEGKTNKCPECGGMMVSEELINEKKDACYYKVKSRYKVWPSAYASGALVKCRKKGASNWGKGSKKKTNEDTATEPRKFTKPPGTTIKWSMGLEALLDEYVLLQAQRSAALYRNRHDLAMKHMEKMDELEELILKKPNGQKELDKVKTWMHKKDPKDTKVDDPEKSSDKAVNFQKMVDLRRQGKSYPTIAAELSAMTGKTFKPNSVKSYIGSRPDFADIQQDFAKARGVLP